METDKEKNQALRILCIVFTFLAINFFLCRGSIAQTETSPTREADIYRDIQVQFEQERYKYQRYRDIVLEHKRLEQIKEDLAAYPPKITEKKKKSGLLNNIYPYASVSGVVDDNIYQSDPKRKTDFITSVRTGLAYDQTATGKGDNRGLLIKGGFKTTSYAGNPKYNLESPQVSVSVDEWPVQWFDGYFKLGKTQKKGKELSADIIDSIVDFWNNSYGVNFHPPREDWYKRALYWNLGYYHVESYYAKPQYNYRFDNISADLYFKMPHNKKLLIGYDCQYTEYPKRVKSATVYNVFWGGIVGEIFQKLSGMLRFGYGVRNPEKGRTAGEMTADINLNYQSSKTLSWGVRASKKNQRSTNPKEGFTDVTTVGFSLTKKLLPRQSLSGYFSYQNYEYSTKRKDKAVNAGVNLNYDIMEWLRLICSCRLTWNKSNEVVYQYQENVAEIKLTTEF